MGTTSLMETMALSSIVKAHAYCIFVTLRSKMQHKEAWQSILQNKIDLPTPRLHNYDGHGNPVMTIPISTPPSSYITPEHPVHLPSLPDNSQSSTCSEHPVPDLPDNSQSSTRSEHPVPDLPCLPDNTQSPCPEHPSHKSSDANPSQTITEFADDIPNPKTLNHELQSRIPVHVNKTKHTTEIAIVIGNTVELKKLDELRHRIKPKARDHQSLVLTTAS